MFCGSFFCPSVPSLKGSFSERSYRIVSSLRLGGMDYENFVTDLLADWAFLENVPGCGEDGNVLCCLRVGCPGREDILVVLDGTGHVALAALA